MKNTTSKFFLALLVALPVFGTEHEYSYSDFTQSASHRDLTGANFEGARILGSRSFGAANLTNANLRNADFSGVNLEFADLTGANLRDANFSKVYLRNATLTGTDLTGTDFTDAWFNSQTKWPDGFDPLTIGAHGPGMDYSGKEFALKASHRDLTGANFEGSRIVGVCQFGAANLTNANLRNADFSGVNLEFANLTGADLKGTDLREIKYNSQTDWTGAIYSVHTQWPEGFDPKAAGAILVGEVPTTNPDGTGLVHYKQEYEKAKVRLDSLKEQTEEVKKTLVDKDEKILQLGKQIEEGGETLLALKADLKTGESDRLQLINKLQEANQTLVSRMERVVRLQTELAQSSQMASALEQEITSESSKLEEKTAQYAQLEITLATPHIDGWHYTPTQGWLFTEVGTYPLVFAEQSQSWLYYDQGTSAPWWYFNYSNETWMDWKSE